MDKNKFNLQLILSNLTKNLKRKQFFQCLEIGDIKEAEKIEKQINLIDEKNILLSHYIQTEEYQNETKSANDRS